MKWLDQKGSLYNSNTDNIGRNDLTFRQILFSRFGVSHNIYGKQYNDLDTIIALRKLDKSSSDYEKVKTKLKNTLQAYTPAALLQTREVGKIVEIERTGLLQLDFDKKDNPKWDLEKLKVEVFKYPFIVFCGKSCSGDGFFALAAIAEPEKLKEYANQMFTVFSKHDIILDTSKGRNVQDLRYVSYDSNMLYREDPAPLKINTFFKTKEVPLVQPDYNNVQLVSNTDLIVDSWLKKLRSCTTGSRMVTIQKVAAALGSKRNEEFKLIMLNEIKLNPIFEDQREEFLKSAKRIFEWGWQNPMKLDLQAQSKN